MAYTTYNCDSLTGGVVRALDSYSIAVLDTKDRAIAPDSGKFLYFVYNAVGTAVENVATHPYIVRPDDYVDQGNWEEQLVGAVSDDAYGAGWNGVVDCAPSKNAVYDEMEPKIQAAAIVDDNCIIRGDGGARGVQHASTITVDDDGNMINTAQPAFLVDLSGAYSITHDTNATIPFDTEVFDQGSDFNITGYYFVVPVTGKYLFTVTLILNTVDADASMYTLRLSTNTEIYYSYHVPKSVDGDAMLQLTSFALMTTGHQAYVQIEQTGGATQTMINEHSKFGGYLVC